MTKNIIPEHFADTSLNISLSGNMVRIDFGSLQSDLSNPQSSPELSPCHRLVMPLNGFVKMVGDLNGMMLKLEENGVVARRTPKEGLPNRRCPSKWHSNKWHNNRRHRHLPPPNII